MNDQSLIVVVFFYGIVIGLFTGSHITRRAIINILKRHVASGLSFEEAIELEESVHRNRRLR